MGDAFDVLPFLCHSVSKKDFLPNVNHDPIFGRRNSKTITTDNNWTTENHKFGIAMSTHSVQMNINGFLCILQPNQYSVLTFSDDRGLINFTNRKKKHFFFWKILPHFACALWNLKHPMSNRNICYCYCGWCCCSCWLLLWLFYLVIYL